MWAFCAEAFTDGKTVKISPLGNYSPRIYQDSNGNYVIIDPRTNTSTPVVSQDGTQQKGPQRQSNSGNRDLTDSQKLEYNALLKEATELRKQRDDYQRRANAFAGEPNDPMYKSRKSSAYR